MFDHGGLYLQVRPSGTKTWYMKYQYNRKEKKVSFGRYPAMSLKKAREKREKAKKELEKGLDPSALKKIRKLEIIESTQNTFQSIGEEWWKYHTKDVSAKHALKIKTRLDRDIYPHLGLLPIKEIKSLMLLKVLREIEQKGFYDLVKRERQYIQQIFRYALLTDRIDFDPSQSLTGVLKSPKVQHYRCLDFDDLPGFLKALNENRIGISDSTCRAIWFSLLTFQRPGEIRKAEWSEINFDKLVWKIPDIKMKMGLEHIVPLSNQAADILKLQKQALGNKKTNWVFPSRQGHAQPMSDGTVTKAIARLGFGKNMVAHGFRALARTAIREQIKEGNRPKYDNDVVERQLSHTTREELGEAYDRSKYLELRIEMMQDWSDLIFSLKK